jgi:iron complex outermembrane receptor protein
MACAGAQAQSPSPSQSIVVTGSLREAVVQDAPFAISVIDDDTLRAAGPMVNLSEALARVPGLTVANRNNYAQDLQISARGFGARAGFGVRGVRLYADGIPATMPDGQGQVAHFDLAGAARVEVLRGPFSALYGNSSGGVIALVSAPAREGRVEVAADGGSFGLRQGRLSLAGPLGDAADVRASVTRLDIDGFRPQSAAARTLGQVRLNLGGEGADRVTLTISDHEQSAADPLGLTRAQFDADPRQTTPQATQFDTRKTVAQVQAGVRWRHLFAGNGALREASLMLYDGSRDVAQWLAIAPGTQANVRHGGGVIDFARSYGGGEARLRWALGDAAELATGVVVERQRDERKGFENFTGLGAAQVLGVTGRLRRDETNRATTREGYAQVVADVAAAWQATAGVRGGRVELSAEDRYLANGDDSGRLQFSWTSPVVGLRWRAAPGLTLHASAARGFESPTLGELAYRADNAGGFNTALQGQRSRQWELGAKWRSGPSGALQVDAALFDIATRDEIGVLSNAGGRASFQNVGRTQRRGAEFAAVATVFGGWRTALSLTVLDASYRDAFLTCTAIPCNAANVPVPAGNRVAGTGRGSLWGELASPVTGFGQFAVEWRVVAKVAANDLNTEAAPGHALVNLRWSHQVRLGEGQALELLARLDNAADRRHAGSVIVNDGNGRFYEPGAPRNALVSVRFVQRW